MHLKKKTKFIVLLVVEIILIVIHKILDKPPTSLETWVAEAGWHYWAGLIFGIYLVYYIFTYDCKKCGTPQIWLSPNILKWKWPKDNCWKCDAKL